MDEKMANTSDVKLDVASVPTSKSRLIYLIVALVAGAIYLGCSVSPPSLMDDVDGAVSQIARNMVTSGDWVTPRADGIAFLEKPAMFYWPIAVSFEIFGIHDWAARTPFACSAVALACLTCASRTWKRLRPLSGFFIALLVAAPWHILAARRNPPYFYFGFRGGPGEYHGFLWFYFINEQVLRFLNLRYPRDYNTVPRVWFWLFHFLWLFPWSVYFPTVAKLSFRPVDRAGRARLLTICWIGFILVFFTLSTTQEYYSMPCYPAMALLLGSAMAEDGNWIRRGTRVLSVITGCAGLACITIFFLVRNLHTPGDISSALGHHPSVYTLSLGHMMDLTFDSFAYLRLPLAIAAIALLGGAFATARWIGVRSFVAAALMMVLFYHAARLAMVVFDPFLSSRPLVEALLKSPDGRLIVNHNYWTFSSITFYSNRDALNLNGRYFNLEYGSYAPGAPDVFIDDARFKSLWQEPQRYYLVAYQSELKHFEELVGQERLTIVAASGGKVLLTNHPLGSASPIQGMSRLSATLKNQLAKPWLYR